jgi:hypothetical protein
MGVRVVGNGGGAVGNGVVGGADHGIGVVLQA